MTAEAPSNGSFINALFYEEPAGAFVDGYVFKAAPDLNSAQQDPDNGYWRCDIADHDSLTWSEKVYELFALPAGTPVEREWAVACYSERSRTALERLRNFGLNRDFGFILDAEIRPEGAASRWIRVLAVPILAGQRVVGLHGVKRALLLNPPGDRP
jgi:hypothetical protein